MGQCLLDHSHAVDVRAVFGIAIAEHVVTVDEDDLGVVSRDLTAGQDEVAFGATADPENGPVDRDDAMTERIANAESRSK
jgi:hypothetical protein